MNNERKLTNTELPSISIQTWGLETGLIFFEQLKSHVNFKKKFRAVLEHDPEKPATTITFQYPDE